MPSSTFLDAPSIRKPTTLLSKKVVGGNRRAQMLYLGSPPGPEEGRRSLGQRASSLTERRWGASGDPEGRCYWVAKSVAETASVTVAAAVAALQSKDVKHRDFNRHRRTCRARHCA